MSSSQLYRVNERATNTLPPYPNMANDPYAHDVATWGFEEPADKGRLPVREPAGSWDRQAEMEMAFQRSDAVSPLKSLLTPTTLLIAAAAYLLFLPTRY